MKVEVAPPNPGSVLLQLKLFEESTAEADLWDPTFIVDYPAEVSPLARRERQQPRAVTERFELFIAGREIANGFSELNDPEDQAAALPRSGARPRKPATRKRCTTTPTTSAPSNTACRRPAGCGIGIDRLVMLLTDSANIRDVILFPQMRPE
jgi:lysyl-tRNA synthetase class 2